MRYLVGFVCVLAALAASPLGVDAQGNKAGTTSEAALQLVALDSPGMVFTLISSPTVDGYTLEEMELRVKRTKLGLGVSAGSMALGFALFFAATAQSVS